MNFCTQLRLIKMSAGALALTLTTGTQADTLFGIYAGAGTWQTEYSGNIGNPAVTADDLGIKDNDNNFYYAAIEHPVPFLPNIKLQQNNITSHQTNTIENSFGLGDNYYASGSTIKSDFDLSYTDATLYYELLDNWLNLDLGVTLRKYSGFLQAESNSNTDKVDIDIGLPLAYARFQFDLPLTGFSAGFEGNYMNYDGNDLADYSAKISYLFDSSLDVGIDVGYRVITTNFDDKDVQANLEMKGPYLAALFHF